MGVWERIERLIEDDTIDLDLAKRFDGNRAELLMSKTRTSNATSADNPDDWVLFKNSGPSISPRGVGAEPHRSLHSGLSGMGAAGFEPATSRV